VSTIEPQTKESSDAPARRLYHHVSCEHLKGLNIQLTRKSPTLKKHLAILGMSSTETIRSALRAVDASPFKTVFVVREATGEVLFALSQNEEYVEAAKKKKPKPTPPPPPPPSSPCCQDCYRNGGYACDSYSDGSCICYGAGGGGTGGGVDDELETLAF
jgi:hypothetical protein